MAETSNSRTTLSATRKPPVSSAAFQVRGLQVGAVDGRGALEAHAGVAEGIPSLAGELEGDRDRLGDAVNRQVAGHGDRVVRDGAKPVAVKVMVGNCSTSRKSAERMWLSRSALR